MLDKGQRLINDLVEAYRYGDHIEDITASAKYLIREAETVKERIDRKKLNSLFHKQIDTLLVGDCPKEIIKIFFEQKKKVIDKASEMTFTKWSTPFLPIIPQNILDLEKLMPMVRNNNQSGFNGLDSVTIHDIAESPITPYYIFDVEDGWSIKYDGLEKTRNVLKEQSRLPLITAETIALCVHTNVLLRHHVLACGSHYSQDGIMKIPMVLLDVYDRPALYEAFANAFYLTHSPASCGSR